MKKYFVFMLLVWQGIIVNGQNCGLLDATFGTGGMATGITQNNVNYPPGSQNIIVQPDNKIIQAVNIRNGSFYDFGIIRYQSNGSLDPAFGTNGRVNTPMGSGDSYVGSCELQVDGKIIMAGYARVSNNWDFALVRYNSNGNLDSSFGVAGKVITAIGNTDDYAMALKIQADGKIVVVGSSGDNLNVHAFATVRYNSNGSLDSNFGQNGKIVTHLGPFITYIGNQYYGQYAYEYARAVVVQTDGKIVVAGESYSYNSCYDYYGSIYCNQALGVIRYNNNGSIDSSFGNNGKIIDSLLFWSATSAALQTDGKIVISGNGTSNNFVTARYNANGKPDSSFSGEGIATPQFGNPNSYTGQPSTVIRPNGKIVVSGRFNGSNSSYIAVVQYNTDGSADSSFNVNGTAVFYIGQPGSSNEARSVALQDDKIVVGGNTWLNNNTSIVVARLLESAAITPIITASGALAICTGNSVTLSCSGTGNFQWYVNNLPMTGATASTFVASNSGAYTVSVNNANGCGISSPVVVVASTPYAPSIWANQPTDFCSGDSIILYSNVYDWNQWYKNGIKIAGAINNTLTVKETGNYTAKYVLDSSCASSLSNSIVVTVYNTSPITPIITAAGPTTFCSGASVLLNSDAVTLNRWYKNGVLVNTATGQTLTVLNSGTYAVKVGIPGCETPLSNTITVTVNNNPVKPLINWSTPIFSTTAGYHHYQWWLNDVIIAGSDSNSFRATQTGEYKVTVFDSLDCRNTSDSFLLRVLAVGDIVIGESKIRYYPNPVQTVLNIEVSNPFFNKLKAEVYDVSGKLVYTKKLNQTHNQLALQKLSTGFYQLVIRNEVKRVSVKLIVGR